MKVKNSMNLKEKEKRELYEEVRELHYNTGLTIPQLAIKYKKSERTIYRWLKRATPGENSENKRIKKKSRRRKKYPPEIFARIIELKKQIPQRSAPMIERILHIEFEGPIPKLSTIQKFIREQDLVYKPREQNQGYIAFQRSKPNDLWQIDIAGVQTVGHLKQLYLIALLDDCSRFIVAAEYFRTQKGVNVLKVIRDAVLAQGRPNEILADNGAQFRNVLGELGTKYSKLLESLGIKPIFARPRHPETKGKLERWFRTVMQMFLTEARVFIKQHPKYSLKDFNHKFTEWVDWYNTQKPHWSLPHKTTPDKIYYEVPDRIFRPLTVKVKWDKWLRESNQRKVNKYNTISYKSQKFEVPPGHMRAQVDVIEYEDKIEIYHKDKLLITHFYDVLEINKKNYLITRRIRINGTISYKGKDYTIDYKFGGKTVEVQEINQGRELLVYLNGHLIKTLDL
ncbi:MAG: transposase [Promethearchaeota archaeon]|nr:MAG: transposase [Candidatus Lokiarchaeota archaeon]